MGYFAGLEVSLEETSVGVIDETGKILAADWKPREWEFRLPQACPEREFSGGKDARTRAKYRTINLLDIGSENLLYGARLFG